jgi:beta-lactamase regulating signal transducer with metallopeptidase domain
MVFRLSVWLGAEAAASAPWLALTITYLAHSVLWSCAAALLVQRRTLSSAARNLCWKLALFGPFLSALLASAASARVERAIGAAPYVREISVLSMPARSAAASSFTAAAATNATANRDFDTRAAQRRSPVEVLAMCGLGAAGLGLLRFVVAAELLRRRLRARQQTTEPKWLLHLETIRCRIGLRRIRLTESSQIASPLVIGATEVCIPQALIATLAAPELESVLAHELAHIERGDGIWFPIVGLMQSVLWLHPLNYWLSVAFRRSAELACDDRAVELTRNPLALARALVQVASRASRTERPALTPAMVRARGVLLPRVARLTGTGAPTNWTHCGRGRAGALITLTLIGGAAGTLTVQVAQAQSTMVSAQTPAPRPSSYATTHAAAAMPPDAEEQSRRMAELAQRAQQLTSLLEAAQGTPNAPETHLPDSARVLEWSQELRHVRATQAWLEQRFVDEWAKWDAERPDSSRAPH